MREASDEQLVADALAGGPKAFDGLVRRYRRQVVGVAFARLRDFDEAEDVAQQVFVEAFECLHLLKDPSRVRQWLRTAAIHRSVDTLRRRRDYTDPDSAKLRSSSNPEAEVERREMRQIVRSAIGRLSLPQRETVSLFYLADHKIAEVAALQDVPVGTVKRRLHDARQKLKAEVLRMVEDTLSNEAPKEDFSDGVFELLTRYYREPETWPFIQAMTESQHETAHAQWEEQVGQWEEQVGSKLGISQLADLGPFERGMKHPHALTRRHTLGTLYYLYHRGDATSEVKRAVRTIMLDAIGDPNKKIRDKATFWVCRKMGFSQDEIATEVVPRILPLLQDHSGRVRRRAAIELCGHAQQVPLNIASQALASHPESREARRLVEMVLAAV